MSKLINILEESPIEQPEHKLLDMEQSVQMYEQLKMKHEFIRALRALFLQSFECGRWSIVAQLLIKYGQAEADKGVNEVNKVETITGLVAMLESD